MKLFDYLDQALLKAESRAPKVSREAFIWPSSASAALYDQTEADIVGKCHRAEIWKMIGEPQTNPNDCISARRFRMGRACEADIVQLAKDAGVFVASGVRAFIPDINMTLELDLVTIDPKDKVGYIGEVKSIYGFYSNGQVIRNGNPKKEAVMQLIVYLNEFRTGAVLKDAIKKSVIKRDEFKRLLDIAKLDLAKEREAQAGGAVIEALERKVADLQYNYNRNRVDVNFETLEQLSDGPLGGRLLYESRDECSTREFEIGIWEDPASGKHFPQIDGEPYRWFDIESIYSRWRQLQAYFTRLRDEALRRLAAKGFEPPDDKADPKTADAFWSEVGVIMRSLTDLLPPAEYEWSYSRDKIEACFKAGYILKTRYGKWQKGAKGCDRIGAWQCAFCNWKSRCVPMEYPEMAYLAMDQLLEEDAA